MAKVSEEIKDFADSIYADLASWAEGDPNKMLRLWRRIASQVDKLFAP